MKKMLNTILLVSFVLSPLSALADNIRVFCYYVPKGKEAQPVTSVAKLPYKKLMQTNGKEAVKAEATFSAANKVYMTDEQDLVALLRACSLEIEVAQEVGTLVEIMASDASHFETVAYHYKLRSPNKDLASSMRVKALEDMDEKTLKGLNLNKTDEKTLTDAMLEKKADLNELADKLRKDSRFQELLASVKSAAGNSYVISALTVAALLASWWFAPALYAGAVDLLFPIVYQAMFGVPSAWTLQYWLVFYPARMHAVAWAYNNATLITLPNWLNGH